MVTAVPDAFEAWTVTARWIFPVDGPPLERATLTIRGDRLVAAEACGRRTPDVDLGNVAILPGLVNAHTHLDLSDLRGKIPPTSDVTHWLRSVIAHRRRQTPEDIQAAIAAGIAESLRFGTTLIGDIASRGLSWNVLRSAPLRSIVFYELLGLAKERVRQAMHEVRNWLQFVEPTATCRPGVSPHAPYSVGRNLFAHARELAKTESLPLAVHLAETAAELSLLRDRSGPFPEFLKQLGVWDETELVHDTDEAMSLCGPHSLFIHGNYLTESAQFPEASTVVYCPRTHAAFGHPPHPFVSLLQRGINVALGTDSLASNPDLDVLAEARFVRARYPDADPAAILRMATLNGARALGWENETGSLTPGKSADFVVLRLPDRDVADPHDLVLHSTLSPERVLYRGQWRGSCNP
jgi:aminodeoxyfutalosine deaminase